MRVPGIVVLVTMMMCSLLLHAGCSEDGADESSDGADSDDGQGGNGQEDDDDDDNDDHDNGGDTGSDMDSGNTPPDTDGTTGGDDSDSTTGDSEMVSPDCWTNGDDVTTLVFINRCDGILTVNGSDMDTVNIDEGSVHCEDVGSAAQEISSVRYWGFIGPDPGGEHHTLAELTLNTDFYDFDWYNISHVDAHNLPMAIIPLGQEDCPSLVCADELLTDCPEVGRYYIDDQLVSCVSPDRDNPDSVVAQYFEEGCNDAYSWSGDDADSMAACAAEDFSIVFCP